MSQNAVVEYTAGHTYKSKKPNGKHGFIYKNAVKTDGKCSMILPVPTNDSTSVEVIDTTAYATMMDEFYDKNRTYLRGIESASLFEEVKVGIYTLIVGREIAQIHAQLGVQISKKLSDWLLRHYPKESFTFLTCIWEGDMNAQPIQIEYTPTWADYLFFPMMESHGDIPAKGSVNRNHYLTASTGEVAKEQFVSAPNSLYQDYVGLALNDCETLNGDAYLHAQDLETLWTSDLSNINFMATPL
jgi:hypothetical protein